MMGVNVMRKSFHFSECQRLPLLTHNVFNAFGESGIVVVPEDTFIPASADTVEFNVILYNMLAIVHLEAIDSIFSVSGGVYRTKLSVESLDKVGPIIKPVGNFIGVKEGWLKEFQGSPSEIGKHKGHLVKIGITVIQHPYVIILLSTKSSQICRFENKNYKVKSSFRE